MAYLAPIHQASSVRHAIKLHFISPEAEDLVVAKSNRLEVYSQTEDGLSLIHSRTVYGRITLLQKLRPESSPTEYLFIGTDRHQYFTASWNRSGRRMETGQSFLDLADSSSRDSQVGDRSSQDRSGNFISVESYEGIVTLMPIVKKKKGDQEVGSIGEPVPVRIPEMFVRSSTFFESKSLDRNQKPQMAFLYEDGFQEVRLKSRVASYSHGLSGDGPSADLEVLQGYSGELDPGMSLLIPVRPPVCGLLILGESAISYWETTERKEMSKDLDDPTIFVCWEQIDDLRYIFADEYGTLYLFMLILDGRNTVTDWKLDRLGSTSTASCLVYLGNGRVFVGSHAGDSQVIAIRPGEIEIVQTLSSISPILDFTILDIGTRSSGEHANDFSSGQARLITGSGAFKDGSLRSVRSGVGLEDLGVLDQMENVLNLFSISSSNSGDVVDTLIVSFVNETRVFSFSTEGSVEELGSLKGMSLDSSTLYAANTTGDRIVQITPSQVLLMDREGGMLVSEWSPPNNGTITAAAANETSIILAIDGSTLVSLGLSQQLHVASERTFGKDAQIACITLASAASSFCAVAFWNDAAVSILSIQTLQTSDSVNVDSGGVSAPRDLLIANMIDKKDTTLFVALADGRVVTYALALDSGKLSNEKGITLSTQQAKFHALPRSNGLYNVFASCEQPTLVYGSEGRMTYSAINAETVTSVCAFNTSAYPGAIAVATNSELKIAVIDEERSTHVQGKQMGETVRRIAWSPSLKAFGLGTVYRSLQDQEEKVRSSFKLVDQDTFAVQTTLPLNDDELVESVMRAELPDGEDVSERFVVGTAYVDSDATDSVRGRLIILEVTNDRQVKIVTELEVKGACRCLAMAGDMIVAALVKTVVFYTLDFPSPSRPILNKVASYRTSTAPLDLAVSYNERQRPVIAVADLMKSLSIITVEPAATPGGPLRVVEIGRHFETSWLTAVAKVEENTYLQSDSEGNLVVLSRDVGGLTEDDRRRLRMQSELHLGELVNRIKPIEVATPENLPVTPRAFVATVEGGIHLFALIRSEWQDRLMRLQDTLASVIDSLGNITFGTFRGFTNVTRTESDPFRFVDGELIEKFLDIDEPTQQTVMEKADLDKDVTLDEMRSAVESLRRLR